MVLLRGVLNGKKNRGLARVRAVASRCYGTSYTPGRDPGTDLTPKHERGFFPPLAFSGRWRALLAIAHTHAPVGSSSRLAIKACTLVVIGHFRAK